LVKVFVKFYVMIIKCDLLEIYDRKQFKDIKMDPASNWNVISVDKGTVEGDGTGYGDGDGTFGDGSGGNGNSEDLFDFTIEGEDVNLTAKEQTQSYIQKQKKNDNAVQELCNKTQTHGYFDDADVDIDDI
jgi:hypothetical protein